MHVGVVKTLDVGLGILGDLPDAFDFQTNLGTAIKRLRMMNRSAKPLFSSANRSAERRRHNSQSTSGTIRPTCPKKCRACSYFWNRLRNVQRRVELSITQRPASVRRWPCGLGSIQPFAASLCAKEGSSCLPSRIARKSMASSGPMPSYSGTVSCRLGIGLGECGQFFIGRLFFVERLVKQANRVLHPEPLSPRFQGAIARDFIVLDGLCRSR